LPSPVKVDFCLYHDGCEGKPFSTTCSIDYLRENNEYGWLGVANKDENLSLDFIIIKCFISAIASITIPVLQQNQQHVIV
jgi:hypothetical protein